ncbi:MAG: DNA repair protein RadA [Spirochaetia bacterium]|nr:DNA repair protein RadA [Spirochaetia bacterium]
MQNNQKQKTIFKCGECGEEFLKWMGQCTSCRQWNSLEETKSFSAKSSLNKSASISKAVLLNDKEPQKTQKINCGLSEFNRLLGGGFTAGSVILLGGEPGVGKSTLLLCLAKKLSNILYVSGEESLTQIKERAERLKVPFENLKFLQENDIEAILQNLEKENPNFVFIDSIQTVYQPGNRGFTGSVSQIREAAQSFLEYAKKKNTVIILTGHITKDGQIAGPKLLEHAVDVVLYFENQNDGSHRFIRAVKNRFGAVGEIAIFSMNENGLVEIPAGHSLLHINEIGGIGSVFCPQMEGSRVMPLEIQALVTPINFPNGRRIGENIDISRIHLISAILEKYAGYKLSQCDIFIRVRGGTSLKDAGGDLALLLAIASSYNDKALPVNRAIAGEVSLTGKIRKPSHLNERRKALASLGVEKALWGGEADKKITSASINEKFYSDVSAILKDEFSK